jgi:predicted YcjX-like family ATPase
VVKPFFLDHFARLDRQIVLVDALQAINAGADALADLEAALTDILLCFRPGRASWLAPFLGRRIGKILFAASKADHLHHENHRRLEALLRRLVSNAIGRASFAGAEVEVMALAAVRATREAMVTSGGETLPVIAGVPIAGESIGGTAFDGKTETAIFPGDLPENPERLLKDPHPDEPTDLRFVRFRPPPLERTAEGITLSLPHIRLDRALQFLLADQLE